MIDQLCQNFFCEVSVWLVVDKGPLDSGALHDTVVNPPLYLQ